MLSVDNLFYICIYIYLIVIIIVITNTTTSTITTTITTTYSMGLVAEVVKRYSSIINIHVLIRPRNGELYFWGEAFHMLA